MSDRTVVCVGHVNWDVTLYVDRLPAADGEARILDRRQSGGGSASNVASVLASLGYSPVLVGSTGTDEHGSLVREELAERGVDCSHLERLPEGETTVKYLVVDESGQVMMLATDGTNEAFDAGSVPAELLERADHLHLTGQRPATATTLARRAGAAGVPVSFDPGRRPDLRGDESVYRLADVLFLNEREKRRLDDAPLDESDGITVVTRGEQGARAVTGSDEVVHEGFDADPVDTTGAGDAFAAGFIAARLGGKSVAAATAVGNACGALTTEVTGARRAITRDDLARILEESSLEL